MHTSIQKISRFTSLSLKTIKGLFFAFLTLFFFASGTFNTIVMGAFLVGEYSHRDLGYFIGFTVAYIALTVVSVYKTITTIKEIRHLSRQEYSVPSIKDKEPVSQKLSFHDHTLRVLCSWPLIIMVSILTLFISYIGIAILFVIAFKNPYFLYRGIQSYIEYLIMVEIVSGIILGLWFTVIAMILQRVKFFKKD